MRASLFGVLAMAGLCAAAPFDSDTSLLSIFSRSNSPDNTCGNTGAGANKGFSCSVAAGNAGGCCSGAGWCGNTTDYCDSGCQTAFGTCNPEAPISNTDTCGLNNGGTGLSCTGGLCCSQNGFCGNTTDYCSTGCQSAYGACNANAPAAPGGTCGPQNGGAVCPNSQCCSVAGFCGTTEDFCSDPNNCAPGFGRCDSDATPTGTSTIGVARPLLGSVSYTDDVVDCVSDSVVALSFDDGPYLYTDQLLDILKTYGYRATFFITGNNNGRGQIDDPSLPYVAVIKRMIAEGHQVASHTWSHYSLDNSTSAARMDQMVKNEMALVNIIGKFPTYMRPPYSQCVTAGCQADMKTLGYHRVLFDLDTQDYLNPLPSQIQASKTIVAAALKVPGITDYLSIQHDIVQQSVTNLSSYYFDQIKAKGWKGVTVGECLGDPNTNWYRTPSAASGGGNATPVSVSSVSAPASTVPAGGNSGSGSVSTSVTTSASASPPGNTYTPPPASLKCLMTIGKYCGKLNTFNNQKGCVSAMSTCKLGFGTCILQNGLSPAWIGKCIGWMGKCGDLNTYCGRCGKSCSDGGFWVAGLG